jgi:hypothetical protein
MLIFFNKILTISQKKGLPFKATQLTKPKTYLTNQKRLF